MSLGEYAVKQAKAKQEIAMIARRKRMLQTFLNRIARHPILSNEHVFHRFLDREVSWVSVIMCQKWGGGQGDMFMPSPVPMEGKYSVGGGQYSPETNMQVNWQDFIAVVVTNIQYNMVII